MLRQAALRKRGHWSQDHGSRAVNGAGCWKAFSVSRPPLPGLPGEIDRGGEVTSGWAGQKAQRPRSPQGWPFSAVWQEARVSDSPAHVTLPRAMAPSWAPGCIYPEDFQQSPGISLSEDARYIELPTCLGLRDPGTASPPFPGTAETLEPAQAEGHGEGGPWGGRGRGRIRKGRGWATQSRAS